jgi:hypothetical protein
MIAPSRALFSVRNFLAAPGVFVTRIESDTARRFMQIQNKGDYDIYVNFGDAVPTEANSLVVPPGSLYEPFVCPVNELKIAADVSAAGSSRVVLITDTSSTSTSN